MHKHFLTEILFDIVNLFKHREDLPADLEVEGHRSREIRWQSLYFFCKDTKTVTVLKELVLD